MIQPAAAVAVLIAATSGILALIVATSGRSEGSLLRSLPAVAFLATTTFFVESFGAVYLLFPELAALAYGVFARPGGAWARSPFMLVATPSLTAIIGTLATRHFAYGLPSLAVTIAGGVAVLRLLGSPIAPALSAGVLPLTLGVSSWWYPPAVFLNASILALLSLAQQRFAFITTARPSAPNTQTVRAQPFVQAALPFAIAILLAYAVAAMAARRLVLFPPLVVIAYEMFVHPDRCPWAGRPFALTISCMLSATAGELATTLLGVHPSTTAAVMAAGIIALRSAELYAPPVRAVGLIPLIALSIDRLYPLDVGIGVLIVCASSLAHRSVARLGDGSLDSIAPFDPPP